MFVTPPDLIVTAPELTLKSSEEKDATPLLLVLASSPATVIVVPVAEVLIPEPPATVKVSEPNKTSILPLSVVASKSCEVISEVNAIVPVVAGRVIVTTAAEQSTKIFRIYSYQITNNLLDEEDYEDGKHELSIELIKKEQLKHCIEVANLQKQIDKNPFDKSVQVMRKNSNEEMLSRKYDRLFKKSKVVKNG